MNAFPSRRPGQLLLASLLVSSTEGCRPGAEELLLGNVQGTVTRGTPDDGDPAVVAILREGRYCTGTLIAAGVVLTAAHCLVPRPPQSVFFGSRLGQAGVIVPVASSLSHPSFDPTSLARDIAVLRLDPSAPQTIAPACPLRRGFDPSFYGKEARLVGFGRTSSLDGGQKHHGVARVADYDDQTFKLTAAPSQPCSGDSGGPVYLTLQETEYLAGVISSGDAACTDYGRAIRVDTFEAEFIAPFLMESAGPSAAAAEPSSGCVAAGGHLDEGMGWLLGLALAQLCRIHRFSKRAAAREGDPLRSQPVNSERELPPPSTEEPGSTAEQRGGEPYLFLVHQADRPFAPCARFCLAGIEAVALNRARAMSVERHDSTRTLSIQLSDSWMSARHARLKQVLGRWIAEDLGSRNGTRLNHSPLKSSPLGNSDLLEMGHTYFIFRDGLVNPVGPRDITSVQLTAPPGMGTLLPQLSSQFSTLAQIAKSNVPVIIQGETGTGKELVARGIHQLSQRAGPLVAVNCNAIPSTLIESELFGYRKGSFSGAVENRSGLVRSADQGTLFLDEIADLPLASQGSLLRVLQERQVLPLGEVRPVPIDVRVCAASHQDLQQMVARQELRADLYARLSGFTLQLPPLRERREDLGLLIGALLRQILGGDPEGVGFHSNAARALFRYSWPFNIRELQRCLEAALVLSQNRIIRLEHLPAPVRDALEGGTSPDAQQTVVPTADAELKERLVQQLTEHRGNVAAAARALGKEPMQIRRWLKRFQLELRKFRA